MPAGLQTLPPAGRLEANKKLTFLIVNPKKPSSTFLWTRAEGLLCTFIAPTHKGGAQGGMVYWDPHAAPVRICSGHIRCQSQYSFGPSGMLVHRHSGHGCRCSANWANFTHAFTLRSQTAPLTCYYLLKLRIMWQPGNVFSVWIVTWCRFIVWQSLIQHWNAYSGFHHATTPHNLHQDYFK